MKPVVIVSFISLAGIGIGVIQQSRLVGLHEESQRLAKLVPNPSLDKSVRRRALRAEDTVPKAEALPIAEIDALLTKMARIFKVFSNDGRATAEEEAQAMESRVRLLESFATLDQTSLLTLIARMKTNPELPAEFRDKSAETCVQLLMEVNPKAVLDLVQVLEDFPYREGTLNGAFAGWSQSHPQLAVKWFEDESANGNPITRSPGMLRSLMLAEVVIDPSRALARAVSKEVAENPDSLVHLGAAVAGRLDGEDEHRAFFSALRRAGEQSPGSEALARIRREYVAGLRNGMCDWPADSGIAIMNSEFEPAEKALMIDQLARSGNFDDQELWATWMLENEMADAKTRPLNGFLDSWSDRHTAAAEAWLNQIPASELKDQLVEEYAHGISNSEPARGMRFALGMEEGPLREKIISRLGKAWKKRDAPAAAAFFQENGLDER